MQKNKFFTGAIAIGLALLASPVLAQSVDETVNQMF